MLIPKDVGSLIESVTLYLIIVYGKVVIHVVMRSTYRAWIILNLDFTYVSVYTGVAFLNL
jgi:hypothetical protein